MSNPYWDAFFVLHRDLPREGPGSAADVAWAAKAASLASDARILDAACGPGADIPELLKAAPDGHVTALDKVDPFVTQAQRDYDAGSQTSIQTGDMFEVPGPYDFIWCAGAVYFVGVAEALKRWRPVLSEGGCVAFSQVCWFTDTPSQDAQKGWADYSDMTNEAGVLSHIQIAGYECLAARRIPAESWENYYAPLDERIADLRPAASGALSDVLDEAEAEARLWRENSDQFGYLLCVVRPL